MSRVEHIVDRLLEDEPPFDAREWLLSKPAPNDIGPRDWDALRQAFPEFFNPRQNRRQMLRGQNRDYIIDIETEGTGWAKYHVYHLEWNGGWQLIPVGTYDDLGVAEYAIGNHEQS